MSGCALPQFLCVLVLLDIATDNWRTGSCLIGEGAWPGFLTHHMVVILHAGRFSLYSPEACCCHAGVSSQ